VKTAGTDVRSTPVYSLVVVAASAGGLAALSELLMGLPAEFPLPIAVVQHVDPRRANQLVNILSRRTSMRVKEAAGGDPLTAGVVYVAPPDEHMIVAENATIQLSHTAPIHFLRPSADRLFETAALACGRVIAVILTGTGSDGAVGVAAIKAAGGAVIVQDEASSAFFGMPRAAIDTGVVDFVLPLDRIGSALLSLAASTS